MFMTAPDAGTLLADGSEAKLDETFQSLLEL